MAAVDVVDYCAFATEGVGVDEGNANVAASRSVFISAGAPTRVCQTLSTPMPWFSSTREANERPPLMRARRESAAAREGAPSMEMLIESIWDVTSSTFAMVNVF